VFVVVDDEASEVARSVRVDLELGFRRRRLRQRRNAHRLAWGEPRGRIHSAAIHADLTRTTKLLDRALSQAGEVSAEPAIEPNAGFII
jgi:hypothetical protein